MKILPPLAAQSFLRVHHVFVNLASQLDSDDLDVLQSDFLFFGKDIEKHEEKNNIFFLWFQIVRFNKSLLKLFIDLQWQFFLDNGKKRFLDVLGDIVASPSLALDSPLSVDSLLLNLYLFIEQLIDISIFQGRCLFFNEEFGLFMQFFEEVHIAEPGDEILGVGGVADDGALNVHVENSKSIYYLIVLKELSISASIAHKIIYLLDLFLINS